MIDVDTARAALATEAAPLPPRSLPLAEALGRRLAASPLADVDLPPADVSAMDGYAARSGDLRDGTALAVAFEIPAGTVPPPLPPGAAARIFTGAPLPEGADTVVEQERARPAGDRAVLLPPVPPWTNVRRRGELFAAGEALARPGDRVTPQRLALLAAGGAPTVEVIPRPRVAVLTTGSELAAAGERPGPGRIRDSNGPLLDALVRSAGLAPPERDHALDERPVLRAALQHLLDRADLVITTGGVSVGDYDLVPAVVEELGGATIFHRVAQKPGKPVLAARLGSTWLIGLPGNPLAVVVGWRLYALPLLRALAGDPAPFEEDLLEARLTGPARNRGRRT
ncbi:MAG TPA: molybdopterin molybdenumtransferase MoeA, partial [Acidobacteria bacterium]|nr:molybdopterin molybdenumtransferase MoeA [Acidobacteriota bacterium]